MVFSAGTALAEALRALRIRDGLRAMAGWNLRRAGMAAALPVILVMASATLRAGHARYGLARCGRALLVLVVLLVLRVVGDLQERGLTLLHFGNNPAKMP